MIAGDVDDDGDGDGGNTSATLAALGGTDWLDIGGTESFAVMFDIDEDGYLDVIAGVPAGDDLYGFDVAEFSGSIYSPGISFGTSLPAFAGGVYGSPTAAEPHLEFTIENFSALPTSSSADLSDSFSVAAFMGSFSDAGIGEDHVPGAPLTSQVCFDSDADGWTTCDGDCDDDDGTSYPGAAELCDDLDNDGDGIIDDVDWAGAYGVLSQYGIWGWQADQAVLTAGKVAANVSTEVEVTLTVRNLGANSASGTLTDTLPAGWSIDGVSATPSTSTLNGDGTTTVTWAVSVVGSGGGVLGDPEVITYTMTHDDGTDVDYEELPEAMIDFDDGGSMQTNYSLPALVWMLDVDGDGVVECPVEPIVRTAAAPTALSQDPTMGHDRLDLRHEPVWTGDLKSRR